MTTPKISLMISGTQTGSWSPLAYVNNPPFPELKNQGVAGVGSNPYYFTVRIAERYTQYTLAYNAEYIKNFNNSRDGALKISISIPKEHVLAGDATPYDILEALRIKIETDGLERIKGREGVFAFKATFPDKSVFDTILGDYTLVGKKSPHRVMHGPETSVGYVRAGISQIKDLLRDVQYPEFAGYGTVAIAENISSDNTIKTLDIPRKTKYEVYLNDSDITRRLESAPFAADDSISLDILELLHKDPEIYEQMTLNFKARDLSGSAKPDFPQNVDVMLDNANECIRISATPKEKTVRYKVTLQGTDNQIIYKDLHITAGFGKTLKCSQEGKDWKITLRGRDITDFKETCDIVLDPGCDYRLARKGDSGRGYSINETNKIVTVYVEKKPVQKPVSVSESPNKATSGVITLEILLEDIKNDLGDSREATVTLKNKDIKCVLKQKVFFQESSGPGSKIRGKEDGKAKASIEIPESWLRGNCLVHLETDKVKTANGIRVSTQHPSVTIYKNDTAALSFWDKSSPSTRRLITGGIGVLCLLVALAGGVWLGTIFGDRLIPAKSENPEYAPIDRTYDEPASDQSFGQSGSSLRKTIEDYNKDLGKEGVTFDEIRMMNNWAETHPTEQDKSFLDFKKKLNAYLEVEATLNGRDITWLKVKEVAEKNKALLTPIHYKYLTAVWIKEVNSNGKDVLIQPTEEQTVTNALRAHGHFDSFQDIPSSKDILDHAQQPSTLNHTQQPSTPVGSRKTPTKKNSGNEEQSETKSRIK